MLLCLIIFSFLFVIFIDCSCPNDGVEYQSNCYIFNTTESGFSKAELSCIEIGGHLASIHDAFVNGLLGEEAPDKFQQSAEADFWIGANKFSPNGSWIWTDGTPLDFNDWKSGEPQNTTGVNCVALSINDGYWGAQDCFKPKPFVCEVSSAPTYPVSYNCTLGWTYFTATHSCYGGAINLKSNWTIADNYCQNISVANLPSIHSYEEYQFLATFVNGLWNNIWVGLYSVDSGQKWKWTDNTPVDYLVWEADFPHVVKGESYVMIPGYYGFRNYDSSYDNACTVCKKPITIN